MNTPLNYIDANEYCQNNYASYLAIINDVNDNNQANSLCNDNCWIGVNDMDTENDYKWINNEVLTYSNFDNNALLNLNDTNNKDCVYIDSQGDWIPTYCNITQPFICEYTITLSPTNNPTVSPTENPTRITPTTSPTLPTMEPTSNPTIKPTSCNIYEESPGDALKFGVPNVPLTIFTFPNRLVNESYIDGISLFRFLGKNTQRLENINYCRYYHCEYLCLEDFSCFKATFSLSTKFHDTNTINILCNGEFSCASSKLVLDSDVLSENRRRMMRYKPRRIQEVDIPPDFQPTIPTQEPSNYPSITPTMTSNYPTRVTDAPSYTPTIQTQGPLTSHPTESSGYPTPSPVKTYISTKIEIICNNTQACYDMQINVTSIKEFKLHCVSFDGGCEMLRLNLNDVGYSEIICYQLGSCHSLNIITNEPYRTKLILHAYSEDITINNGDEGGFELNRNVDCSLNRFVQFYGNFMDPYINVESLIRQQYIGNYLPCQDLKINCGNNECIINYDWNTIDLYKLSIQDNQFCGFVNLNYFAKIECQGTCINSPTNAPTLSPTTKPTPITNDPSKTPTNIPTPTPTKETYTPTVEPTKLPTITEPTQSPSKTPTTSNPTDNPTNIPTESPTFAPTNAPTPAPCNCICPDPIIQIIQSNSTSFMESKSNYCKHNYLSILFIMFVCIFFMLF